MMVPTTRQQLVAYGVFPFMVLGVLLPFGLTMLFVGLLGGTVTAVLERADLWLIGGNASFGGSLVLLTALASAPPAPPATSSFTTILSVVGVISIWVIPCYGAWALISALELTNASYARGIAESAGIVAAVSGTVMGLLLVARAIRVSHRVD